MKKTLFIILVIALTTSISCKKTRTCFCKATGTKTLVVVPQNGFPPHTNIWDIPYTEETKYAKATKKDMQVLYDCNSRKELSLSTYTKTYTSPPFYKQEITETTTLDYICEIK